MKKLFVEPELDVMVIHTEDVLQTSGGDIKLPDAPANP